MTDKLKVGVIGVGSLGQWHARIYSELEDAEFVGIYDANKRRANEIAKRYKTSVFDTVEELAAEVDAASVVVPTHRHLDVASILMEQDVHLLVEKPIADTTADAEAMVKMADDRKLILQVGHVERFNPVLEYLEDVLDKPAFIEAERLAPYPPRRRGQQPRGTEVSVVLDLMIHDLEIIFHLVRSKLREFHAVGVPVLSPSEDIANVRLCFENGCVANVSASRISREQVRKIRVFQQDTYLSLNYQKQSGHMYRNSNGRISRKKVPLRKGAPLDRELATFVDCVIRKDEPMVSGRHASEALKLAVSICEHISEGGS